MKKKLFLLMGFVFLSSFLQGDSFDGTPYPSTWANWERRLTRAFKDFNPRKLPGRALGILLPQDPRRDILPLTAYGYEVLSPTKSDVIVLLMSPPKDYPLNGIVMPDSNLLTTSFGLFPVDNDVRTALQNIDMPVFLDSRPFGDPLLDSIQTQLAALKFVMQGKTANLKILPMMVKFQDLNSQAKDIGPFIAETIKDMGFEGLVRFVILSDLTRASSEEVLIQVDNTALSAVRNLDLDSFVGLQLEQEQNPDSFDLPDIDPLGLGIITLRWLGSDHAEVLTYAHSAQLVLTKDKSKPLSYVVAGFASDPPFPPRIPHMEREKLVDTFDELFRSDILSLTRQTFASIVDPTAAKPPSLLQKQASKKWPVFISLYNSEGNLVGEAGTHKGLVPLEEGIRQYTFDAAKKAGKRLDKSNVNSHVVEVSIPYGFSKVSNPEDLIPLLNGIVVTHSLKSYGFHPNGWRKYPSPHQLLGAICHNLGLKPWSYATRKARIESFRVLAFNEKEPFQDLGAETRKKKKKKKKKKSEDDLFDDGGGGFDDGGAFPF